MKKSINEVIHLPTSQREGETEEEMKKYEMTWRGFETDKDVPLTGHISSIPQEGDGVDTDKRLMNLVDAAYAEVSKLKQEIRFVDMVERKEKKIGRSLTEEEKKIIFDSAYDHTKRKMEELQYFLSFAEYIPDSKEKSWPKKCHQVYDIAGGPGEIACFLTLEQYLKGNDIRATVIDPVKEYADFSRQIRRYMPAREILKDRVSFQQSIIQELEIPDDALVIAKHPCGELVDILIEKWERSKSPKLVIMTCCQGKAQNCPDFFQRYGFNDQKEWKETCKKSDWTNNENTEKRKQGVEAMRELDSRRISYLKQKGFMVGHIRNEDPRFPKGDVIVVVRK